MGKNQYIAIAVAVALIVVLYVFGNTVPPAGAMKGESAVAARGGAPARPMAEAASWTEILSQAKAGLNTGQQKVVTSLEAKFTSMKDSGQMKPVFGELAAVWKADSNLKISAYYEGIVGKLDNSGKKLTFAARIFLDLMAEEENPGIRMWEAQQAVGLAERSFTIDTAEEETKLALATGYIEGTGEPMRGVQLLLGIVSQKPDDIPANLLLGKMSVQSGQLDKAVARFEKVLTIDSLNKEANYYLAETWKQKGENNKAREQLEKCKRLVNDPEFSARADEEIKSLK